jgi:class 3 adenylate cyclase
VIFLTAVALWLPSFALSLHASLTGMAMTSVIVEPGAQGGFPRVTAYRATRSSVRELELGDELLSWGGISLVGATDVDLFPIAAQHTGPNGRARVTLRRAGVERTLDVGTGSYRAFWPRLPASIVFLLTAAVFVFRSPSNPLTRSIATQLTGLALLFACTFSHTLAGTWLSTALQIGGVSVSCVSGLRTTLLFPHGVVPQSRLLRLLPYPFVVLGPLDFLRTQGWLVPTAVAHRLGFVLYLVLLVVNAVFAFTNYRRANALERRKLKWLLWAVWISALISGLAAAVAIVEPALSLQYYVALSSLVLIPLALLIAITRYNLFDIDRILSATASLSLLFGVGLAALLFGAPPLTRELGALLSIDAGVAQPVVVVGLAGLGVFGVRIVHPWIDGKLFVERAALQRGLGALLREVASARTAHEATELVGRELTRLLSPDTLAIYQRDEPIFRAAFVHGGAIVPAVGGDSGVLRALSASGDVLSFERGSRQPDVSLSPLDRGLLEALDARVVLGVREQGELVAAIFIGPKGSGDLFVRSDIALLSSIAHALSAVRTRLLHDQGAERSSIADAALRSYVPGPLVSQIVLGVSIERGEQDVTLMFLDIRGYSTYAERRAPSEVFSMVSAYTHRVSEVVLRNHGTVVEFNGDGMMAVFGAPSSLAAKEEAAVQTALEILAVADEVVPIERSAGDLAPIGVGIASGRAFVGSIKASDRSIWTALGASTNRAARLQGLTRELRADLVIDEATFRALGVARRRFARHANLLLRGHSQRIDVYSLALTEVAAPAVALNVRLASG